MSESSPPRKAAKGTGARKKKQAPKVEGGGAEPGQGEVLPPQTGPKKAGVVRRKVEAKPRAKKIKGGVPPPGDGAGLPVRSDADVQGDLFSLQPPHERRVLGDPHAVGDPHDAQNLDRVDDGIGTRPLPGVDEGKKAESANPVIDGREVAGGQRGLVAPKPEPKHPSPGRLLLEIENALRGRGAPLPHRVEKDPDPAPGPSLERREDGLQLIPDRLPAEPDLLDDGGGDVDLRVPDPLAAQAAGDVPGDQAVVGGKPDLAADVAVELQETAGAGKEEPLADRSRVRENSTPVADGEPSESRLGDRPLQVEMKLGLGQKPEVLKEAVRPPVIATSVSRTGSQEISAALLQARAFERYWLRGAALGIDLIVLAGVPFLAATLLVFVVLLFSGDPPRGIEGIFHLAQISFAVAFLLRDSSGLSPGKRFLGLRAVREGGRPVGPVVSILRNLPLLLPGLNFVEAIVAGRDARGRRLGDRLARTFVLEE